MTSCNVDGKECTAGTLNGGCKFGSACGTELSCIVDRFQNFGLLCTGCQRQERIIIFIQSHQSDVVSCRQRIQAGHRTCQCEIVFASARGIIHRRHGTGAVNDNHHGNRRCVVDRLNRKNVLEQGVQHIVPVISVCNILVILIRCVRIDIRPTDGEQTAAAFVDVAVQQLVKSRRQVAVCNVVEQDLIVLTQLRQRLGKLLVSRQIFDGDVVPGVLCSQNLFDLLRLTRFVLQNQDLVEILQIQIGVIGVVF